MNLSIRSTTNRMSYLRVLMISSYIFRPCMWYIPNFPLVLSAPSQLDNNPNFHVHTTSSHDIILKIPSSKAGATILDRVSNQALQNDARCGEFANTKQKLWTETKNLESFLMGEKVFTGILYIDGFRRKHCSSLIPSPLLLLWLVELTIAFGIVMFDPIDDESFSNRSANSPNRTQCICRLSRFSSIVEHHIHRWHEIERRVRCYRLQQRRRDCS